MKQAGVAEALGVGEMIIGRLAGLLIDASVWEGEVLIGDSDTEGKAENSDATLAEEDRLTEATLDDADALAEEEA
jgi:hypothetical protein